ncbi:MAG: hypothetical protein V3R81_10340, partial [Gammaproteobacteria bacterium]
MPSPSLITKQTNSRSLVLLATMAMGSGLTTLGYTQIEISDSDQKWVGLAETAVSEVPFVGPFLSAIVGLSFTEKDKLPALRTELQAYTDASVLAEDHRLKQDILAGYQDDLKAVEEAKNDPLELLPHLRITEANMNRHFESFESLDKQKATRNLLFMSTQAQLHLQVLNQLTSRWPDSPFWKKRASDNATRYHDYAKSQVEKVIKERMALVVSERRRGSYIGGPKGTGYYTYYEVLVDHAPTNFLASFPTQSLNYDQLVGPYSALVEAKTRRFWDEHLLLPIVRARHRMSSTANHSKTLDL